LLDAMADISGAIGFVPLFAGLLSSGQSDLQAIEAAIQNCFT
jgi:hypothetical protein